MLTIAKLILDRVFLHLNEVFIFEVTTDVEADWNIYLDRYIVILITQNSPSKAFELTYTETTKTHGPLAITTNIGGKAHIFQVMATDIQIVAYVQVILRNQATTSKILARHCL